MEAYYNCMRCKNKRVRILTNDGRIHEGVITDVDRNNVYLRTERNGSVHTSAYWGNPYASNNILTLSLFTLLAIALI